MMLDLDAIWFAEYSPVQGAFHVETAREMIQRNLVQILEGWTNLFLVFAVCDSPEEASRACDVLREALRGYSSAAGPLDVPGQTASDGQPKEPAEVTP
jgi:hypothetical protein